jgi:pimeloyl-ACP methyl ester carboxylesterase
MVSTLSGVTEAAARFTHDGFDIAYIDLPAVEGQAGRGRPILLIHGFASSYMVNWVGPGWTQTLTQAGYRVIALDNRGHGASTKVYDPEPYSVRYMADDAAALLDHLGIGQAHVMGYSMGARIAAFMALRHPQKVATLILGGLGIGMVDGVGDWDPIAAALLAEDPASVTHSRGKMFRAFADQTKSDRRALAACIGTSRELLTEAEMKQIAQPVLVAVGTRDDVGGSPEELAGLLPRGESFAIEGRDHMLAVGDRSFKTRALEFLAAHPI